MKLKAVGMVLAGLFVSFAVNGFAESAETPVSTEKPAVAEKQTRSAEASKHLTLEEIVVTDSAISDPAATVVGTKTIERGKNVNIPDALKYEADIDLRRRANMGDTADILSIRGLSSNRIMLNINGRPINACGVVGGYYIDWGTIPLDNIERLEIIKGGSSAIYGNNALGGMINVVSKKPTEKPTFTLYGNYAGGEADVQNYRASHSYKVGPIGYSISGSYQKGEEFLWNNDFEGKNLSSSVYVDMPLKGELSLGFQYANSERGFIRENRKSTDPNNPNFYVKNNPDYPLSFGETIAPGWGKAFSPGPGGRWDKTKYYLDLGYKQPIGDGILEFNAYKNIEDRKEKNYSYSAVVSSYPDGVLVLDRKVESDRSYGGNVQVTEPIGAHEVVAGIDYKVLAYGDNILNFVDTTYNGGAYTGNASSQEGVNWGYYGQDTWKVSDSFLLTAGLRYDTYHMKSINGNISPELKDKSLTPKLTGTYKLSQADTVTASVYQAVRTPGLPETWWWGNGQTRGNPVLRPEKNTAGEMVYQHSFAQKDYVCFSTYYYSIEDYIVFRGDPNWRGVYNIADVKLYGGSVEGKVEATSFLTARASVTYQKSKKKGDAFDTSKLTNELDYLPEWKGNLGLEWKLPYNSVLTTSARYVGEQQTIYSYTVSGAPRFQLMKLDSYVTADLDLRIPVTKQAELGIYAENVFDKKYEERFGYPLPGRVIGANVKFSF